MAQATAPILDSTFCDIARSRMDFRFRGKSGRAADITGTTESDPEGDISRARGTRFRFRVQASNSVGFNASVRWNSPAETACLLT
jgi:hypothetical protein